MPEQIDYGKLGIKFRHFFDKKNRLSATIATKWNPARDKIIVALSLCNRRDKPSRALGRNVALERLDDYLANGAYYLVHLFTHSELKEALREGTILKFFPVLPRKFR